MWSPQGYVLGPLFFFICFTTYLSNSVTATHIFYADDVTFINTSDGMECLNNLTEITVKEASLWFKSNRPEKSNKNGKSWGNLCSRSDGIAVFCIYFQNASENFVLCLFVNFITAYKNAFSKVHFFSQLKQNSYLVQKSLDWDEIRYPGVFQVGEPKSESDVEIHLPAPRGLETIRNVIPRSSMDSIDFIKNLQKTPREEVFSLVAHTRNSGEGCRFDFGGERVKKQQPIFSWLYQEFP